MDLQSILRPAVRLSRLLGGVRGHKTTARTKRALKIAPHDSFLPHRSPDLTFPAADSIIFNPPASEPSAAHTPFLFLPADDARRLAMLRVRRPTVWEDQGNDVHTHHNKSDDHMHDSKSDDGHLPPAMHYKKREPRYHLGREHIDEMRRLRAEDPLRWSVGHLAKRFDCSPIFVQMAAPAPAEHLAWLRQKLERKMQRWGPIRRQAWEDRKRRAEMLYRGEL